MIYFLDRGHCNQTFVLNFHSGATRCYLQAGGERYGSYVGCWWLELEQYFAPLRDSRVTWNSFLLD